MENNTIVKQPTANGYKESVIRMLNMIHDDKRLRMIYRYLNYLWLNFDEDGKRFR